MWLCQIHLKEISTLLFNWKEAEAFQTVEDFLTARGHFPARQSRPGATSTDEASSLLRVKHEGREPCYLARLGRANSASKKDERKRQRPKFKKRKEQYIYDEFSSPGIPFPFGTPFHRCDRFWRGGLPRFSWFFPIYHLTPCLPPSNWTAFPGATSFNHPVVSWLLLKKHRQLLVPKDVVVFGHDPDGNRNQLLTPLWWGTVTEQKSMGGQHALRLQILKGNKNQTLHSAPLHHVWQPIGKKAGFTSPWKWNIK